MTKCMSFKIVGSLHIIVVGEANPTNEDWSAYVEAVKLEEKNGLDIIKQMRTLVFSDGGGPTATQRKIAADVLNGRSTPVAIVTGSTIMRGVITALRWFNPEARAFSPSEVLEAMAFLDIPAFKQESILQAAQETHANLKIPPVKSLEAARAAKPRTLPAASAKR